MKDLSLHLLDILENAAKAGASRVEVALTWRGDCLLLTVTDNGPGLPTGPGAAQGDPTDPYYTSRRERQVGLGLPLLRAAAEQTGGWMRVESTPGKGVRVAAGFHMGHVDAKPLGDLCGALLTAAVGWPCDLVVLVGDVPEPVLDTGCIRAEIPDLPFSHPQVSRFIEGSLREGLEPVLRHADGVRFAVTNVGKSS